MQRELVDSTALRAVSYNADSQILEIEFQSGEVYRYFEVPAEVYWELIEAESRGRYFVQALRNNYPFVRLDS